MLKIKSLHCNAAFIDQKKKTTLEWFFQFNENKHLNPLLSSAQSALFDQTNPRRHTYQFQPVAFTTANFI